MGLLFQTEVDKHRHRLYPWLCVGSRLTLEQINDKLHSLDFCSCVFSVLERLKKDSNLQTVGGVILVTVAKL